MRTCQENQYIPIKVEVAVDRAFDNGNLYGTVFSAKKQQQQQIKYAIIYCKIGI